MRGIRTFFSNLFKSWSEKLEKPKNKDTLLRKRVPVPGWLLAAVVASSVVVALISEFGITRQSVAGAFIFTALWTYISLLFMDFGKNESDSKLLLTAIVMISAVLMTQFAESRNWPKYIVFTPFAASILNFLVSRRNARVSAVLLGMIAAFLYLGDFEVFFVSVAGGLGALAFPRRLIKRTDIFLNGLSVFIFLFIAALALELFGMHKGNFVLDAIQIPLLVSASTAVFVMGLLPLFESVFNLTSDIRLLELGDFNHPLLKKLMVKAPGTYHHSLMVATLAEAAASEIGCNGLLARVGSYYHDIGKIGKPQYFIENQLGDNAHEKLKPEMSALVILAHVKEGLMLAREYGIDDCIKDFITQHHGTTIVQYFFRKAEASGSGGDETTYKYPGPLPQTRETAIVMLADSVEASCRAIDEPNYEKIKNSVNKIINNYFTSGQLNECPITLKNIQKIGEVFTKTIISIHHIRLQYPDAPGSVQKPGALKKNGSNGKKKH